MHKVGFDAGILDSCWGRGLFFVVRDSFFVVLRSLASAARLKIVFCRVWKSGQDAQKLTINNKFHVKRSDG